MTVRIWVLVLALMVSTFAAVNAYSAYGAPSLPPLGTPAQHPVYRNGKTDYVTALRYESVNRTPYRVESAYAYQVDGQTVKVAKVDTSSGSTY